MPSERRALRIEDAAAHCHDHAFQPEDKTTVGVELEWLTTVGPDRRRLPIAQAEKIAEGLGSLPGGSRITIEPGGQLELSSAPFTIVDDVCSAAATDLFALDQACVDDDVDLIALGADPDRAAERVVTAPRYRAMATYFDSLGPHGRTMMCNTAALQVNIGLGPHERLIDRWHLANELGPSLIASFVNSPLSLGGPSGWQSSRLRSWWFLDPSRSSAVSAGSNPADQWLEYALDARVMFIRADDDRFIPLTEHLSFGQWLAEGHELGWPTLDDLTYHLTTLFPPVRPKGWLELRMFDTLPTPFWQVATAVTATLLDDDAAASDARRAVEGTTALWVDAAQLGLGHPHLAAAASNLFEIALEALERRHTDPGTVDVVARYHDRWVARGRSPADDRLRAWREDGTLWPGRESPVPYVEDLHLDGVLP